VKHHRRVSEIDAEKKYKAEQELASAKEQLKEARSVIEFYGNPESWIKRTGEAWNKSTPFEKGDSELIRHYKHPKRDWTGTINVGGKRAREFLSKYPEKK
jgi:hypothetical protein